MYLLKALVYCDFKTAASLACVALYSKVREMQNTAADVQLGEQQVLPIREYIKPYPGGGANQPGPFSSNQLPAGLRKPSTGVC